MEILKRDGEHAALAYLKRLHAPGEGTLSSSEGDPWKETDHVYHEGKYVLYYDLEFPYVGLLCRVTVELFRREE